MIPCSIPKKYPTPFAPGLFLPTFSIKQSCKRYLLKVLLFIRLFLPAYTAFPQVKKKNYTEIDRIAYYTGPDADTSRQRLNLVIPKIANKPPLLIWVGGGAWSYVNPDMEMDLARKIAE